MHLKKQIAWLVSVTILAALVFSTAPIPAAAQPQAAALASPRFVVFEAFMSPT